ncbi:hypothetical protein [Luteimonas pelagia]
MHDLLHQAADVLLEELRTLEADYEARWVPASRLKSNLSLNLVTYPQSNPIQQEKGWVFAALARLLEDRNLVQFRKIGGRSYYRSTT